MVEPVTSKSSSSHVAECIKLSDTSFDNDTHYTEKLTDNTDVSLIIHILLFHNKNICYVFKLI